MSVARKPGGRIDTRAAMAADEFYLNDSNVNPWYKSGSVAAVIDINALLDGGSSSAPLSVDFSFGHIVASLASDVAATIGIKRGAVSILHNIKGQGMHIIPIGMRFPAGTASCSVELTAASGNVTLQLCNVRSPG